MADTPREAATRRKAMELLARLEREASTPEAIADRADRQARVRREQVDARIDAALAPSRARAAIGELTPAQEARRTALNETWRTKYDRGGRGLTDDEFQEMQGLNEIHARKPPPPPAKPAPAGMSLQKAKKTMKSLTEAVTEAVGKEIAEHQRERKLQAERIEHERELQAARIEAALSKLDAVMARAEANGAKSDRDGPQSRFIVTR